MPEFTGTVTAPGLYGDIPEDVYHSDPVPEGSLSHSGAKKIVFECPAVFDYERKHPRRSTKAMDTGTTVHGLVLGNGPEIAVLDYADRRTKAYKDDEAKAIADGKVPMLAKDYREAETIAAAVKNHHTAGGLFLEGDAEVSMFARDPEYGIWLRSRTDYLTYFGQTPTIVDFKAAASAAPDDFARHAGEYGYHMQDPFYRHVLALCLGCNPADIDFIFVVVGTDPSKPYLPVIYRLNPSDTERGRALSRQAMEKYRDCTESGTWPDWVNGEITELPLPGYHRVRAERIINEFDGIIY